MERTRGMMEEGTQCTHDEFNAGDSDVTIESQDGVLFCLHTQNLGLCSGAFPGSEFSTRGSPTALTENADVLSIVFGFIYPKRHPTLENLPFTLLAAVAEAVEKYEIFPAITLCTIRLREFLPQHADDILAHALRHDHPQLMNESAFALGRSRPTSQIVAKLPYSSIHAWIRYTEAWDAIFDNVITGIKAWGRSKFCTPVVFQMSSRVVASVCPECRCSLILWVKQLEKIGTMSELRAAMIKPERLDYASTLHCASEALNPDCKEECILVKYVVNMIEDGINAIQPFEKYLNGTL